jgi:hypothetical protein
MLQQSILSPFRTGRKAEVCACLNLTARDDFLTAYLAWQGRLIVYSKPFKEFHQVVNPGLDAASMAFQRKR